MIRCASLGSGSAGNALLLESGATCLMVDCGFGLRETVARLARLGRQAADLTAILVTHEHGDHVGGVFRLARKFSLPVFLTHGTWLACRDAADGLDVHLMDSHRPFTIGEVEIQPFPVPHDAREPVQFHFSAHGRRLGLLTDAGDVTPHMREVLSGCDGVVLEFNHDADLLANSAYPPSLKRRIAGRFGHLENRAAAALLASLDLSRLQWLVAAHLSERNNTPALVRASTRAVLGEKIPLLVATPMEGFAWCGFG